MQAIKICKFFLSFVYFSKTVHNKREKNSIKREYKRKRVDKKETINNEKRKCKAEKKIEIKKKM